MLLSRLFPLIAIFALSFNPLTAQQLKRQPLPTDLLRSYLLAEISDEKEKSECKFPQKDQFVVYAFHKSLTLIALTDQRGKRGLEEICISKASFDSLKMTWQQWRDEGYPKALSHFRINWPSDDDPLRAKPVVDAQIPSAHQPLSPGLLQVLWQIDATLITLQKAPGEHQNLNHYTPKVSFFKAKWPDDLSQLANKPLLLHFANAKDEKLDYWPSLIRIGSGFHRQNLIAIASGQFRTLAIFGADERPNPNAV